MNILNAGRRYKGLLSADLGDVDEQALQMASIIPPTTPVLIETIPGNLDKVPAAGQELGSGGGVQAIEVVDGSPRGLTQSHRDRARIDTLIGKLNLAPVSGSDNRGYGRAAPAVALRLRLGWSGLAGGVPARIRCWVRGPAVRRLIGLPSPRLPIAAAAP